VSPPYPWVFAVVIFLSPASIFLPSFPRFRLYPGGERARAGCSVGTGSVTKVTCDSPSAGIQFFAQVIPEREAASAAGRSVF
jgi:hypothetical protein